MGKKFFSSIFFELGTVEIIEYNSYADELFGRSMQTSLTQYRKIVSKELGIKTHLLETSVKTKADTSKKVIITVVSK